MKNLVNFKKFILNESEGSMQQSMDKIPDYALDSILDSSSGDSLLIIKDSVPYLYQILSKRAQQRGINIEKLASAKASMKHF